MLTTEYRSAFDNANVQQTVKNSLLFPSTTTPSRPDTSHDAEIAQALAVNGSPVQDPDSTSPSGVQVRLEGTQTAMDAQLARHIAQCEVSGQPTSLIYPEFIVPMGSRHESLSRSLSMAPSVKGRPSVLSAQLPTEQYISEDRERLLLRLDMYNLIERVVQGDGNCQFRALSDQLYGTTHHCAEVREAVVEQLKRQASKYSEYVPSDYGKYLEDMSNSGTWGDHVTLQAAADAYNCRILVLTSFKESPVIAIEPEEKQSSRVLYISFWAEVHYNSLYPAEEPPLPEEPTDDLATTRKFLGSKKLGKLVKNMHL